MPNLTRRSLLVLGGTGAAGLAVAGCGTEDDPRADGSDTELVESAASAEALLGAVYGTIGDGGDEGAVGSQFVDASSARVDELERLGGGPADASASVEDSPAGANDAQNAAIAAYRDCVRLGSTTELRSTAIQFLTQVSSEQAVVRGLEGGDQSPAPFVTGGEDKPYVASEDDDDADESETTSTTSTSSSTSTTSTTSPTEDGG